MQSRYKTETDPRVLQSILSWFDNFHALPMPQDTWLQCQLALIEGFTNVVRHAHRGLPTETPIEIEITVTTECMDIKIWDCGPGFDFESVLNTKLQQPNFDSPGGRGLSIMYRVADTVDYSRTADQRNCLHIRKCFGASF
ncbi:MAG: ATP-binding protein [Cyanobacteria bacterium J06639_14]